jgi:hypothetical protein
LHTFGVPVSFASDPGWRTQSRASPRATNFQAFGLKKARATWLVCLNNIGAWFGILPRVIAAIF